MGEQYKVVPQALRQAQQSFECTAEEWNFLAKHTLPGWKLGDGDLGLIGRMAGIVHEYNSTVDEIIRRTETGQQTLENAAATLDTVALDYERQDEEYYVKFGWIDRELGDVAPPPE